MPERRGYEQEISNHAPPASPERPARERWREAMELRQRIGRLGLELEALMKIAEFDPRGKQEPLRMEDVHLDGLPPSVHETVGWIIANYNEAQRTLRTQRVELWRRYHETHERKSPEERGRGIFRARVGRLPAGKVLMNEEGGYLLVRLFDRADYDAFARMIRSVGLYGSGFDVFPGRSAKKTKHPWRIDVPMILVDMSHGGSHNAGDWKGTLTHERQHFVNHTLLRQFSLSEQKNRLTASDLERVMLFESFVGQRLFTGGRLFESYSEIDAEWQIKDEMLAFLREGVMDGDLSSVIMSHYQHLLVPLTKEKRQAVRGILSQIGRWAKRHGLDTHEQRRAFFVHQLYDVPFEKMPQYLRSVERYYLDRSQDAMGAEWIEVLEEVMEKADRWKRHEFIWELKAAKEKRETFRDVMMGLEPRGADGKIIEPDEARDAWENAVDALDRAMRHRGAEVA